jgi:hypothetical protein
VELVSGNGASREYLRIKIGRYPIADLCTVDELTKVLVGYGLNLADLVENSQAGLRWRFPLALPADCPDDCRRPGSGPGHGRCTRSQPLQHRTGRREDGVIVDHAIPASRG